MDVINLITLLATALFIVLTSAAPYTGSANAAAEKDSSTDGAWVNMWTGSYETGTIFSQPNAVGTCWT